MHLIFCSDRILLASLVVVFMAGCSEEAVPENPPRLPENKTAASPRQQQVETEITEKRTDTADASSGTPSTTVVEEPSIQTRVLDPLVIDVPSDFVVEKEPERSPPQQIPKEIAEAWSKAGADTGWWGISEDSGYMMEGDPEEYGLSHVLPAFLLSELIDNRLTDLPDPGVSFAIVLSKATVTTAGLQSLAKFKNLEAIDLSRTDLTAEKLSALKEIENLHSLDS